ncbi:MAG: hypothetical protein JWO77_2007 [Ilumatobacteraceae bacterium]|nr:hypothetical protein [Ilumatobacteraceae bacterium]
MSDIDRGERPPDQRAVVGVYRSREEADAVGRRLRDLGISEADIAIDAAKGDAESLLSEMQEEASESYTMPTAGVAYPKEASKSMLVIGVPVTLVCTIVLLPFAFIDIGDIPLWVRLLSCALIGATVGGTIAIVAGPALGAKRANEPLAAQRGVSVRVATWSPQLVDLMASADPIRLDVIDRHGARMGYTVATEDLSAGTGIVEEIERNTADPLHENDPGWTADEAHDRQS